MGDDLLVDLSRLQFATTTLYHYLFVPLTLGLAPYVALLETLHWRTGKDVYRRLARFFGSLLVINFAMGIVTGIVQEFQFGMNWSVFSRFVGDVFGAPLAMEGLLAFFLESTFLGLWLFGRDRLPRGVHVACIWIFTIGTWASAYFIIVANSWMQHPVGYQLDPLTGYPVLNDIGAVLLQPFALWAYAHTVLGGLVAASVFVFAVAAYHLKRRQHIPEMRWAWRTAIAMGLIAASGQVIVGDVLGVVVTDVQPMKIAAGEALWETEGPCASLGIVAIIDQEARQNTWELSIPCVLSLVATNSLDGVVVGANELQAQYEAEFGPGDYTPNVWIAFYAFRLMMGFGLIGAAWMLVAWWRTRKGRLPEGRIFWAVSIWIVFTPWLGNMFGWIFTENARQPWVVYDMLLTRDAVSQISPTFLFVSLPVFFFLYGAFAIVEFLLLRRYVIKGPPGDDEPMAGQPSPPTTCAGGVMGLPELWFVIVAVLWTGFFFLEGFDFGVGMLSRFLGASEAERGQMLTAIGPVWDADEVWLVTGGIAIFAAFPAWYAALFPAAYLPLLIVIVAIVVRAVAIEYRSKRPGPAWRSRWDTAVAVASLLLAFLFGVFWAGIVHGIPIDASGQFVGRSLLSFINVYSVLGGLTLLSFSLAHGATFLALKTAGPVQIKNEVWAARFDVIAGALMTAFAAWTYWSYSRGDVVALLIGVAAVLAMFVALMANLRRRPLIAFWSHGVAIAAFVAAMFVALYPDVLPSTLDPSVSLTVEGAAASAYSLTVLTVVAAIGLPLVIAYQAWSFWVFRKRITVEDAARSHYG